MRSIDKKEKHRRCKKENIVSPKNFTRSPTVIEDLLGENLTLSKKEKTPLLRYFGIVYHVKDVLSAEA